MNNVKITETMLSANVLIPDDIRPRRFAIASNFITCFKKQSGENYFLLFNYEPQKWNQWYPYFYSTNGAFDCHASTYSELMIEYSKLSEQYPEINSRCENAIAAISNLLRIDEAISVQSSAVETEYWIKYSKTQDVWTFYEIEFLQIVQLPKVDFTKLSDVDLLPLDEKTVTDVLLSGKFKGVPIVDNTLDILRNNKMLLQLLEKSVRL
ncbi:hypothetical protein FACS189490_13970 [Clostridia bacterium]|nr:hypothetical protein FACS189490_13970 [Clostridia bacterium]